MMLLVFIYLLLPLLVLAGIAAIYLYARSTRSDYACSQCGVRYESMEYVDAQRCNACGSPLVNAGSIQS